MLLTIIIPVYNEKQLILEVLRRVISADTSSYDKEIIVVDDASVDGTRELLDEYSKENPIKVIRLPENSGKAFAIKTALKTASGDIIMIQDADLEYSPQDYRRLLSMFRDKTTQVVYGSRFLFKKWPEDMRPANWLANRIFTFLINLLYKAHLTDEGTAYKLFRKDTIKSIEIKSSGFEFCPEVTAKILKKGVRIIEVPVSYRARKKKEGKKPGILDGIKVLYTVIKLKFIN